MKNKDNRFGINMKQYCRDHEAVVMQALQAAAQFQDTSPIQDTAPPQATAPVQVAAQLQATAPVQAATHFQATAPPENGEALAVRGETAGCASNGTAETSVALTQSGETAAGLTRELIDHHMEMIRRIQHERLIHLIVTVMVVITELFVTGLTVLHPELGIIPAIIMLGLAVLLGFYFYHYFFLENTVQRWYILADKMIKK
jgi:hypothetical protein